MRVKVRDPEGVRVTVLAEGEVQLFPAEEDERAFVLEWNDKGVFSVMCEQPDDYAIRGVAMDGDVLEFRVEPR